MSKQWAGTRHHQPPLRRFPLAIVSSLLARAISLRRHLISHRGTTLNKRADPPQPRNRCQQAFREWRARPSRPSGGPWRAARSRSVRVMTIMKRCRNNSPSSGLPCGFIVQWRMYHLALHYSLSMWSEKKKKDREHCHAVGTLKKHSVKSGFRSRSSQWVQLGGSNPKTDTLLIWFVSTNGHFLLLLEAQHNLNLSYNDWCQLFPRTTTLHVVLWNTCCHSFCFDVTIRRRKGPKYSIRGFQKKIHLSH